MVRIHSIVMLLLCIWTPLAAAPVAVWTRWEHTLISSRTYDNPLLDVVLRVRYTSPSNKTYDCYGFWDGDDTYRIRFMFNGTGTWKWETQCSDTDNPGLHAVKGTVDVCAYRGSNPLYAKGYLRISDNRRYLVHANGSPFLWIGDTAWTAYMYATDAEWRQYIDDRSRKKINTILMSSCCLTRDERSRDAKGEIFFTKCSPIRINAVAWRNLDQKVQYANDRGILMVITGLLNGGVVGNAAVHEVDAFVKMLCARLAGNHVILSPMQDWGTFHWENHHRFGTTIREVLPFHLITQHLRRRSDRRSHNTHHGLTTGAAWTLHFHHYSYLDFSGLQTGHGASLEDGKPLSDNHKMNLAAQDHIQWIDQVYAEEPHKPVIVLEGMYELNEGSEYVENSRAMVRRQGYWSFLNGACGYTSSCHAIWGWGKINIGWTEPPIKCPPVSQGLNYVYATYLKHMADFFNSIAWWTLESNCEYLINNQAASYRQRMLLAKSDTGDLAVAYLPDNEAIEIEMTALAPRMKARWYRPTNGSFRENDPRTIENRNSVTFTKPEGWEDAILLLEADGTHGAMIYEGEQQNTAIQLERWH